MKLRVMKAIVRPALALAAIGFVTSFLVHALSLLNITLSLGSAIFALHIGIFIVWIPTMIAAQSLTPEVESWQEHLRGCPRWMCYLVVGCFYYTFVNFFLCMFSGSYSSEEPLGSNPPPIALRMFSGHWMAFYSVAFAILYSWRHTKDEEAQ